MAGSIVEIFVYGIVFPVACVIYVSAIVSAARTPKPLYDAAGRSKPATVVLVVLFGFIPGIYYFARIRRQLTAVRGRVSLPPRDTGDIKEWRRTGDPWA